MASIGQVDAAAFRRALSRFATGVVIVTTRDHAGRRHAMTVNAFSSVSLDPPLVLFCLGKTAFHVNAFAGAQAFAINVLAADQQGLSDRFAREVEDDFADLATEGLLTGSPVLPGCLATLDCRTEARHEAGDHLIVVGRVSAIGQTAEDGGDPLLFFESGYCRLRRQRGD